METTDYLDALRREGASFAECVDEDALALPVAHCPGWTLRELTLHLGEVHAWAAKAAHATSRPPRQEPSWPQDAEGLTVGFTAGVAALAEALDGPPDQDAWSFSRPHQTLGFWQRRQLIETAVHRWDAETAVGEPAAFDLATAAEGLDELSGVMVGLLMSRGKVAPDVGVDFVATDGDRWRMGAPEGDAVAQVTGSASDLLLLGWGRLDPASERLGWSGDAARGQAWVRAGLTP